MDENKLVYSRPSKGAPRWPNGNHWDPALRGLKRSSHIPTQLEYSLSSAFVCVGLRLEIKRQAPGPALVDSDSLPFAPCSMPFALDRAV